jgi:hypothetical protein
MASRTACWHDHYAGNNVHVAPERVPEHDEFSRTEQEELQEMFRKAPKPVTCTITFVCASQQLHRRMTS